jgi:hypothetical protein
MKPLKSIPWIFKFGVAWLIFGSNLFVGGDLYKTNEGCLNEPRIRLPASSVSESQDLKDSSIERIETEGMDRCLEYASDVGRKKCYGVLNLARVMIEEAHKLRIHKDINGQIASCNAANGSSI